MDRIYLWIESNFVEGTYKEAMSVCKDEGSSIGAPNLDDPLAREMVEKAMRAKEVTALWTAVQRKNDGLSTQFPKIIIIVIFRS